MSKFNKLLLLLIITQIFSFFIFNRITAQISPHPDLQLKIKYGEIEKPYALKNLKQIRDKGVDQPWKDEKLMQLSNSSMISNERVYGPAIVPSGNWKALVLLVQFSDQANLVNASYFDSLLFKQTSGTMWDYFKKVSYGNLDIVAVTLPSTIGWIDAPQTYAYYVDGKHGFGSYPQNVWKLVEDVVIAADPLVDYSQYDNDSDGDVDALFIVHSGQGAEVSGSNDDIWSHASAISAQHLDGVIVSRYSMEPEYMRVPDDQTIGIFCHELGHSAFGLPDLYDRDYSSNGLGQWSLMAGGNWNNGNRGDSPAFPDAWSHIQMGYITPTIIMSNISSQIINEVETNAEVYKIYPNQLMGNEYFLIENRQLIGYDSALPGEGLLIYHVDESIRTQNDKEWYPGYTNLSHYLVAIEQADGNWNLERKNNRGDAKDTYPGTSINRVFTANSTPNSNDYNGLNTQFAISNISNSSAYMTADIRVLDNVDGSISPISPYLIMVGNEFWVDIKVGDPDQVSDLLGVSFRLKYNTTYLKYVTAEPNNWFGTDLVFYSSNDSVSGEVSIGISRKSPASGVNGSGVIARVKFISTTIIGIGNDLDVDFVLSDIHANDSHGNDITLIPFSSTTKIIYGLTLWPGDTNNDGKVDQADILPIGLYWGLRGPSRPNASTQWVGQVCPPWNPEAATYADANGDGKIDQGDILPIGLNWGKRHTLPKGKIFAYRGSNNYEGKLDLDYDAESGSYKILLNKGEELEEIVGLSFVLEYSKEIESVNFSKGKYLGKNVLDYSHKMNSSMGYSIVQQGIQENSINENETIANLSLQLKKDAEIGKIEITEVEVIDKKGRRIEIEGLKKEIISSGNVSLEVKEFDLAQNYPNPFNPTTMIQYSIPEASNVKLSVYNLIGEEVAILVDNYQSRGRYTVKFDASNLSSGVYFYKIIAGKQNAVKKIILIK